MYDIHTDTVDVEIASEAALPLKDTHRADRRARSRAASMRQLAIARELQQLEAPVEAGRFRKHHSLATHHPAKGKHLSTIQEQSFSQMRLHEQDVAANDTDCQAAA
jgi:hypothetical protein